MNETPEQRVKRLEKYAESLKEAAMRSVDVGLPSDKVGGKIYGDGMTVISIGAIHEYGLGPNPMRSFLRMPFDVKQKQMADRIAKEFDAVRDKGRDVATALGRVGVEAENISREAFVTRGYGNWPDITQATKDAKGSGQVLIDTGTLRNSITHVVR